VPVHKVGVTDPTNEFVSKTNRGYGIELQIVQIPEQLVCINVGKTARTQCWAKEKTHDTSCTHIHKNVTGLYLTYF